MNQQNTITKREPTDSENAVAKAILDAAFFVHRCLGPGLTEKVYVAGLAHTLRKRGFTVKRQAEVPVVLEGERIDCALRLDLLVNELIVVEVKAVDAIHPLHHAQLISYLRLTERTLGLLLNFNVVLMKDGIKRVINSRPPWKDQRDEVLRIAPGEESPPCPQQLPRCGRRLESESF